MNEQFDDDSSRLIQQLILEAFQDWARKQEASEGREQARWEEEAWHVARPGRARWSGAGGPARAGR